MAKETKSKKLKYTLNSLLVALGISVAAHSIGSVVTDHLHDDTRTEIENEIGTDDLIDDEVNKPGNDKEHEHDHTDKDHDHDNNHQDEDDNKPGKDDEDKDNKKPEMHEHKHNSWQYFNKEKEISICEDCGSPTFRNHKFNDSVETEVTTNNDGTHTLFKKLICGNCECEVEKIVQENCSLNNWTYNKETEQEERSCSVCGYTETKKHEHDPAPTNLKYVLDKSNKDSTHNLKATYECKVCGKEFESFQTVECDLSNWSYNRNTKQEERKCSECGYEETRKHNHDAAPTNPVYVLDKSNNNGTHKLKTSYSCSVCNEVKVLYKDVNCNFSAWSYNRNTKQEERECSECGYEETRKHNHDAAPTNPVYVLDKSNNNGTHKLKTSYSCSVCNEEKVLYKDVNCNLSAWTYNKDTKQEQRECSECGYEETKEHIHDSAPNNLVYTLDKTYSNGTHKLKAVYTCNTCNEQVVLYKDESCDYGNWSINNGFDCIRECKICGYDDIKNHDFTVVPNSVTSNATVGLHNVLEKCNDCSYEKEVTVACTGDGNKYFYQEGNIITERENCSICGDVCIQDPHNHTYGNYISIDEFEHKRVCACGNESVEAHSYGSWNVTGDGTNTRTCSSCNHTETVTHTCSLTETRENVATADCCYIVVTTCEIDGCTYETRIPMPHGNIQLDYSNMFGSKYTCYDCGYSYKVPPSTASLTPTRQTTDIVQVEESKVKKLNLI